jgi:hypothetical protein
MGLQWCFVFFIIIILDTHATLASLTHISLFISDPSLVEQESFLIFVFCLRICENFGKQKKIHQQLTRFCLQRLFRDTSEERSNDLQR